MGYEKKKKKYFTLESSLTFLMTWVSKNFNTTEKAKIN